MPTLTVCCNWSPMPIRPITAGRRWPSAKRRSKRPNCCDWIRREKRSVKPPSLTRLEHSAKDQLSATYSFPPVIVYTGRELSTDEEEQLRRYSKSIIIKGAKSPERLLDEVTLFLHQVEAEVPAEQQRMLEKARSRDAALEGRHVLIVEDDVRNVFALTSLLAPRGAIVKIARNGREAIQALERSREPGEREIDLVLMDVMMPEIDGYETTRRIREMHQHRSLPIIALTAKAMKGDREKCIEAGCSDYIAKPVDTDQLMSLLRVWLYK